MRCWAAIYVFRVLLTDIHLMRTGRTEAYIRHLNVEFRLPYIDALVEQKTVGLEAERFQTSDLDFFRGE